MLLLTHKMISIRIFFKGFTFLLACGFFSIQNTSCWFESYFGEQSHSDSAQYQNLVIDTKNGLIRGKKVFLNKNYQEMDFDDDKSGIQYRLNAWLGIPYAEKPIGDLKFKRPLAIKNWQGIYNATEFPNSCLQLNDTSIVGHPGIEMWNAKNDLSEDCLYLNIWAPDPLPKNSNVLVWIHGGGFVYGSSSLDVYNPKVLAAEANLIIVTIQYRLTLFGFLYLDDNFAPGNQALFDQNLALKWIHENIGYFGGDNKKITIFGESCGSISVSLHLLSNFSNGLFQNAIMQSGASTAHWPVHSKSLALERNTKILKNIGCDENSQPQKLIECIKNMDPIKAIEKINEYFFSNERRSLVDSPFFPVIDGYFLEDEPLNLLIKGKFNQVPLLIGSNKNEGSIYVYFNTPDLGDLTNEPVIDYEKFKLYLRSLFDMYPNIKKSKTALDALEYRYTNWNDVNNSRINFENLDKAIGDIDFVCPIVNYANYFASHQSNVYMYFFEQVNSVSYWPSWLGAIHTDEIPFVFGEPLTELKNYSPKEKLLSKKMIKYWSNFAMYHNPNGNGSDLNIDDSYDLELWPKFTHNQSFLILNASEIKIDQNLRAEYCAFWYSLVPKLRLNDG
jgi:acetylcholinesterase